MKRNKYKDHLASIESLELDIKNWKKHLKTDCPKNRKDDLKKVINGWEETLRFMKSSRITKNKKEISRLKEKCKSDSNLIKSNHLRTDNLVTFSPKNHKGYMYDFYFSGNGKHKRIVSVERRKLI